MCMGNSNGLRVRLTWVWILFLSLYCGMTLGKLFHLREFITFFFIEEAFKTCRLWLPWQLNSVMLVKNFDELLLVIESVTLNKLLIPILFTITSWMNRKLQPAAFFSILLELFPFALPVLSPGTPLPGNELKAPASVALTAAFLLLNPLSYLWPYPLFIFVLNFVTCFHLSFSLFPLYSGSLLIQINYKEKAYKVK